MNGKAAWVIFDADNTLWHAEELYDSAREQLCKYLASKGLANAEEVDAFQRLRDEELHATYGYSACRFARSFEDTAHHFHFERAVDPLTIRHARRLALDIFEARARAAEGVEQALEKLRGAGYLLGIITAGERWVQERRLADFHLRCLFAAVEIVDAKSAEVLLAFCDANQADTEASWMIGDSIRSDILPAKSAGLRTALVTNENWACVEGSAHELPPGVPAISSLLELPRCLGLA